MPFLIGTTCPHCGGVHNPNVVATEEVRDLLNIARDMLAIAEKDGEVKLGSFQTLENILNKMKEDHS